jgi:hypothetical protein
LGEVVELTFDDLRKRSWLHRKLEDENNDLPTWYKVRLVMEVLRGLVVVVGFVDDYCCFVEFSHCCFEQTIRLVH